MRFRRWNRLGWGLAAVLGLAGCAGPAPTDPSDASVPAAGDELTAYVVNYPLQYFAERIGGELVSVEFPGPVDEDPAFWSPDAETVSAYQQADRILLNGAGYAHWVQRVTLPASKLIDTSAGFRERYIQVEDEWIEYYFYRYDRGRQVIEFITPVWEKIIDSIQRRLG